MHHNHKRRFSVIAGASSGIGAELARQCLEHGFDIMICDVDDGLERVAAKLSNTVGSVRAVRADLTTRAGVEALARAIHETHRAVDALILTTALAVTSDRDDDAELEQVALSCAHMVQLAKRVVPDLRAHGQGRVLISSQGHASHTAHGATRAFAMAFGEALRLELRGAGVTVTVSSAFDARSSFEAMMRGDEIVVARTFTPVAPRRS